MSEKLVNFKAPEETVEAAKDKLQHGEMSEELRHTLKRIAHGADAAEQTRVKDRLKQLRKQRRQLEEDIQSLQSERDETERDIERLEERLDQLAEQEGEYDGYLKSIEQDLKDGIRVFEGHAKIKQAARIAGCSQADVLRDLQERNPDVPDEQFTEGTATAIGGR